MRRRHLADFIPLHVAIGLPEKLGQYASVFKRCIEEGMLAGAALETLP